MSLMATLINDSKRKTARELAEQERAFKKKEGRYQFGKSILKTLSQFVPGGKLISTGIDTIGDSIFRQLGFGGDPDKFNLEGKNLAFGGEEAVGTMKEGAQDYLDMARERSLTSGLTSLFSFGLDKGWGDKLKDMNPFEKGGAWSMNPMDKGVGMSNVLDNGNAFSQMKNIGSSYQTGDVLSGLSPTGGVGFQLPQGKSPFSIATYDEGGEVGKPMEKKYGINSNPFRKSQSSDNQWWNNLVSGRKGMSNLAPNIQKSISENLNKSIGSESVSNMLSRLPISPLEQRGENTFSSPNLLDFIQKVPESGLNLPQGVSQMSRYAEGGTHNLQDVINSLMKNPSDARYLNDLGYTPEMLKNYAFSKMPSYEQGGMVKKYQEGGAVPPRVLIETRDKEMDDGTTQKQSYYTTYTYDGLNWNKGQGSWENPGYDKITQNEMDNYRSEQRTQDVSSTYMSDPTEFGIQEILKSPQLYSQVEAARRGSEGALENIMEMIRQSRPELEQSNEALRESIKKILPNIDLYGQGYQDVLAGGQSTLEGLTGEAQQLRGQQATQMATSGIRSPGATSSISEGLYKGAEDVYSKMQRDIQGQFDKSFGEFDEMVSSV